MKIKIYLFDVLTRLFTVVGVVCVIKLLIDSIIEKRKEIAWEKEIYRKHLIIDIAKEVEARLKKEED